MLITHVTKDLTCVGIQQRGHDTSVTVGSWLASLLVQDIRLVLIGCVRCPGDSEPLVTQRCPGDSEPCVLVAMF